MEKQHLFVEGDRGARTRENKGERIGGKWEEVERDAESCEGGRQEQTIKNQNQRIFIIYYSLTRMKICRLS